MKRTKGHEPPRKNGSFSFCNIFSSNLTVFQSAPLKCVEISSKIFFFKIKNESMDFDAAYLLQLAAPQSASFQLSFFLNMH